MTATRPPAVATGRLIRLRGKRMEDGERDYSWRADPELAAYDAARPITMSLRSFITSLGDELRYPSNHRRTLAIETIEDARHIGNVMYYGYDPRAGEAELGITIGDREYWSQGYGTDTVRTMMRYLFNEVGLKRVYLHTLTWNYRAQECFRRSGFTAVREVRRSGYDFVYMEAYPGDVVADGSGDAADGDD
ncbi:MAG: GNAT family N-acetyltransferase [Chloroflexi bacterium]|nr:GNAT family N-acetyltransferase [Chloroflexota bacterium]MDA1002322.1 GNAT family N-acetyltransferase [Chloroflexota bacterium]